MYQNDRPLPEQLCAVYRRLATALADLSFAPPVAAVYNPLDYAWQPFESYLHRFVARGQTVLVGMNPGPWGMAQTGIPFGEVAAVRNWMQLGGEIGRPAGEHSKRPVEGLECSRSEVSGRRLWGWAQARFGTPERFFERFLVINYCPLLFLEDSGRNRTPDKLPVEERKPLLELCDLALADAIELLRPSRVLGVGRFAAGRALTALAEAEIEIGEILHPSPASPAANRGWAAQAERQLEEQGVDLGL